MIFDRIKDQLASVDDNYYLTCQIGGLIINFYMVDIEVYDTDKRYIMVICNDFGKIFEHHFFNDIYELDGIPLLINAIIQTEFKYECSSPEKNIMHN